MYIVHIADIHIGSNSERSNEYRAVFDELGVLCSMIKNKIIVIAGDIFHNKTKYTGSDVDDFKYLIQKLGSDIIIIIPGNHDVNMNDPDNIDLLTPLVCNYTNVMYVKKSGSFKINDINFYHHSVFDNNKIPLYDDHILLYHGFIDGAKFGTYTQSQTKINKQVMSKYKLVLAGDIHQHQFITNTVAYPGSLIQQNVSETHDKGFILWNLNTLTGQFIKVENQKRILRVDLRGKSKQEAEDTIKSIKYNKNEITRVNLITDANDIIKQEQAELIKSKLGRLDGLSWLPKINNDPISISVLENILTEHNANEKQKNYVMNAFSKKITENNKWTVLNLSWDNLLCYGSGNHIDFSIINQSGKISGIISPNKTGKSAIIDILIYSLYGEHLRVDRKTIINKDNTVSHVKCTFVVNNIQYQVSRTDYLNRPGSKLELYKYTDKWISITGQDIPSTYKIIEQMIGPLEHLFSSSIYYDGIYDIVRMSAVERAKLFSDIFINDKEIIETTKKEIYKLKKEFAQLQKPADWFNKNEIDVITANIARIHDEIKMLDKEEFRSSKCLNTEIINCNLLITKLQKDVAQNKPRRTIGYADKYEKIKVSNCRPIQEIQREIDDTINKIKMLEKPDDIVLANTAELADKISELRQTIELNDTYPTTEDITQMYNKMNELTLEYNNITLPYVTPADRLSKLSALKFNIKCDSCMRNKPVILAELNSSVSDESTIMDTINKRKLMNNQITQLSEQIKQQMKLSAQRLSNEKIECLKLEYDELIKKQEQCRTKETLWSDYDNNYKILQNDIKRLNKELETAKINQTYAEHNERAELYIDYMQTIKYNNINNNLISAKEKLIQLTNELNDPRRIFLEDSYNKLSNLSKQLGSYENKLEIYTRELIIYDKYQDKYPKLYGDYECLTMYLNVLNDNKLKVTTISNKISLIIKGVNSILQNMTTFTIDYEYDGNKLQLFIIDNDYKLNIATGSKFQQYIISLLIRLSMTSMLCNSCDFMILDEGFGVCDGKNIKNVASILYSISSLYNWMLIITHMEDLQNTITAPMTLKIIDNKSYINNTNNKESVPINESKITQDNKYNQDKITCECGSKINVKSMALHLKTNKHFKNKKI